MRRHDASDVLAPLKPRSALKKSGPALVQKRLTKNPPATESTNIAKATEAATFQLVEREIVKSDGRLTAGPATIIATAAPGGAPAESKINANGISKNVGRASGTASRPTTTIATVSPAVEARAPTGSHSATAIEISTPTAINVSLRSIARYGNDTNTWLECSGVLYRHHYGKRCGSFIDQKASNDHQHERCRVDDSTIALRRRERSCVLTQMCVHGSRVKNIKLQERGVFLSVRL